jgi:hypothetical protein
MGDASEATEHDPTPQAANPRTGAEQTATKHAGAGSRSQSPGDDVMDLLAEHVPLALLADLVSPEGPGSSEILAAEGLPDDAWWETPGAAGSSSGKDAQDAGPAGKDN